jgi:hypothetical protein
VDVTERARLAAKKYLKPDRRQLSTLDKMDRAAAQIEARAFAPRPRERTCAVCAYRLVCPADPDIQDPVQRVHMGQLEPAPFLLTWGVRPLGHPSRRLSAASGWTSVAA